MKMVMPTRKVVQPRRSLPRSLRLRLLLWYGSLLAVALGFFALLFLLLTTGAIDTSVNSAVRTEARVAMLDVLDDLSDAPPYWRSSQLTLRVVDTYRAPGVVVEVLDTQSQVRYLSTNGTRIPLSNETASASLAGQPPVLYDTVVEGQHVRVEALPIRAPVHGVSGNTDGVPMRHGPVLRVLLVLKSPSDVEGTLRVRGARFLRSGAATLPGTLLASGARA